MTHFVGRSAGGTDLIWGCDRCHAKWSLPKGKDPKTVPEKHALGTCMGEALGSIEGRQPCPLCSSKMTYFHPPKFDLGWCVSCGASFPYTPSVYDIIRRGVAKENASVVEDRPGA